jgi:hypothetical protein
MLALQQTNFQHMLEHQSASTAQFMQQHQQTMQQLLEHSRQQMHTLTNVVQNLTEIPGQVAEVIVLQHLRQLQRLLLHSFLLQLLRQSLCAPTWTCTSSKTTL